MLNTLTIIKALMGPNAKYSRFHSWWTLKEAARKRQSRRSEDYFIQSIMYLHSVKSCYIEKIWLSKNTIKKFNIQTAGYVERMGWKCKEVKHWSRWQWEALRKLGKQLERSVNHRAEAVFSRGTKLLN